MSNFQSLCLVIICFIWTTLSYHCNITDQVSCKNRKEKSNCYWNTTSQDCQEINCQEFSDQASCEEWGINAMSPENNYTCAWQNITETVFSTGACFVECPFDINIVFMVDVTESVVDLSIGGSPENPFIIRDFINSVMYNWWNINEQRNAEVWARSDNGRLFTWKNTSISFGLGVYAIEAKTIFYLNETKDWDLVTYQEKVNETFFGPTAFQTPGVLVSKHTRTNTWEALKVASDIAETGSLSGTMIMLITDGEPDTPTGSGQVPEPCVESPLNSIIDDYQEYMPRTYRNLQLGFFGAIITLNNQVDIVSSGLQCFESVLEDHSFIGQFSNYQTLLDEVAAVMSTLAQTLPCKEPPTPAPTKLPSKYPTQTPSEMIETPTKYTVSPTNITPNPTKQTINPTNVTPAPTINDGGSLNCPCICFVCFLQAMFISILN